MNAMFQWSSFGNDTKMLLFDFWATEEIAMGKRFEEVVQEIENTIKNTLIYESVDSLEYLVRSGRLKKIHGFAVKLLNIKLIVSIDKEGNAVIIC
ncbi:DegV family protein [Sporosarcina siberiensis]|uniref:DegV family protein n=1 Tax=Sporosarcina siberiensis TaxID=1365606 RepID=A0ABW4SBX3_9BACL